MAQKTRFHARMCLLEVKNVEINSEPPFYARKGQMLAKKWLWPKTLYNGDADAHLQTTLNRHRISCIVNRQCGAVIPNMWFPETPYL